MPQKAGSSNVDGGKTSRGRLNPLASIPLQCLTPIEGKISTVRVELALTQHSFLTFLFCQDADLSARNVTHRSPDVFQEIIAKSSQVLKKKISVASLGLNYSIGGSSSSAQPSVSTEYKRGYAFYRLQQYTQAAEDFLASSRSDPDRAAPALYNRGCALYKLGKHAEAVRDLTKALKLDSKNPLFIESRARVLKEMGKFEEAIHDYTWLDTLRHHPTDPSQSLLEAVYNQQSPSLPANSSAALAFEAQESSTKAWLERFLKKDPGGARSGADVAEAARLARCWGFFRGMRANMIEHCMRNATYYRFESDQVVVEQGKPSLSFHVVLDAVASLVKTVTFQGSTSRELSTIYQGDTIGLEPSSATNDDGRLVMLRHRAQRQLMLRPRVGSTTGSPLLASIRSQNGFQLNSFRYLGSAVRTIQSTLHPRETATFSSMGEVSCMMLDLDIYLNILREHEERVLEERLQFLRRCHAFGTWSDEMLTALAAVSGAKLVDPGKDALRAGEVVKQLYVIKKGVCHVMKTITIPHSSAPRSSKLGKTDDTLTSRSSDGSWVLDNGWMLTNPRLVTNAQALAASRSQHSQEVTVAVLASGQLFGELSVLQPGQHSPVTVRTQTLVELLVFEEEELSRLRVQYMSGTMNALQESLLFHNPPQQKLAQLCCDRTHWTREKRNVLEEHFASQSQGIKSPKKKSPSKTKKKLPKPVEIPTEKPVASPVGPRPLTSPITRKKIENTRRSMIY
ncbi:hypothetical protein P3T76_007735 [Phytophthora citrophthora]|uniref:Cyclic nucleotide-binding domain-containing protein n=1 Tax=Phytophthora citrophthora TaxID=4793 RepID=A0AAD9GMB3_9STRA|nr:hypothetical protein P3T76_007735 [Phytophthora citrophthora]